MNGFVPHCIYSRSCARKDMSKVHHMFYLTVACSYGSVCIYMYVLSYNHVGGNRNES